MSTAVAGSDKPPSRVLVCDDERHIVRLIQVNLERSGFDVEAVFDSASCLQAVATGDYDLLILDALVSGRVSVEEIIRACAGRIRVILLDRETERQDRGGGPGPTAGAILTLKKPFRPIHLISLIDNLGRG